MKIVDIIKHEGDNETLVWKHPAEDFNTMSQLIVHQSQEAVLFKDGRAFDVFGPGRYTLHTQNIPLINKVINIPTNGASPFHCEVYFINKTIPLDMKWGTNSQVVVQDPKFNILIHAGANGGMGVQIDNSRMFLEKIVGTISSFTKDSIVSYFREMISTKVKSYLTTIMSNVSFVTVNAKLDDMSQAMFDQLTSETSEFGIKLIKFFISAIKLDKDDYEKVQTALANAGAMGIAATAEKGRMDTLGYSWADKEMAEILKAYASNEGNQGNLGGMMAQMPMAFAFGEMLKNNTMPAMGATFGQRAVALGENTEESHFCAYCGRKLEIDMSFCPKCGKPVSESENQCLKCGRVLKDDEIFCPGCGTKRE